MNPNDPQPLPPSREAASGDADHEQLVVELLAAFREPTGWRPT